MRLRALIFALAVLALAGAAAWRIGVAATDWIERETAADLADALHAAGQDWPEVAVDGLEVTLSGEAPDEASRFRAVEVARRVVAETRVADATTLRAAVPLAPPPFALEFLRNEDEVSLIGLVPEAGREAIRSGLDAGGLGGRVTDMLETAAEPAPDGWQPALAFALAVLAELPRAKISMAPGSVTVGAVADSDAARAALEARLRETAPDGVRLELAISAPRPVIAPFAFDLAVANGAATLAACSAESDADAASILAAARTVAALPPEAPCAVGLGAPSPEWAKAAERGIAALAALGGGRFTLKDLSAELTAPEGTSAEALTAAGGALKASLPTVFQLATAMPPQMETAADGTRVHAPRFDAVLLDDGTLRLTGPVQDTASRSAIESYAAALFGHGVVKNVTMVDSALPAGWPARVLAGIEALSKLAEGKVSVTPDRVSVEGWGLEPDVARQVQALLDGTLGPGAAAVDVRFNAEAAAALASAARPRPEVCAEEIAAILDAGSINFAAGSADIVPESRGVIAAIADSLRGCPGADFEIAGHTDSQGSEAANLRLSQTRAQAVLDALQPAELPLVHLSARGYGAARPIADNATEDGRASNRRIEFLLAPPPGSPEAAAEAEEEAALEAAAAAAEPGPGATCVADIGAILADTSIEFDPGSARLTRDSEAVVDAIAAVLAGCPDARIEVAGHTDSQGSESGNQRLSEDRARAVVTALRDDALPLLGMTAKGYGEADPIADNDTAEGRARNRRITFSLSEPDPAPEPEPAPESVPESAPESVPESAPELAGAEAVPGGAAAADTLAGTTGDDPLSVCLVRLHGILAEDSIQFAAGEAAIAPESASVINALAGVLRGCPDAVLEVGGYTDSQGSDAGNLALSQARAEAVLAAVKRDDLRLAGLTARGYGEADPVADNATAEGRAQNRRIAFQLPVPEESGDVDGSE